MLHNYDRVMAGATAELITHGPDVGIAERGQMGNSEVEQCVVQAVSWRWSRRD
jgi:bisphosphoglycerate-independent phosphoglycerate mutase (AlkP superfamily)